MAEPAETGSRLEQRFDQAKQQAKSQPVEDIKTEFINQTSRASEIIQELNVHIQATGIPPRELSGDTEDKTTSKGKATDVMMAVAKVIYAAKENKVLGAQIQNTLQNRITATLITKISENISSPSSMLTITSSPYIYELFEKAVSGKITDIDGLAREFKTIKNLRLINPYLFEIVHDSLVKVAQEIEGTSKEEAEKKFLVPQSHIEQRLSEGEQTEISYDEYKKYLDLAKTIEDKIQRNIKGGAGVVQLDPEELNKVRTFYWGDESVSIGEIEGALTKLGLTKDEMLDFRRYFDRIKIPDDPDRLASIYIQSNKLRLALKGAIKEFDIDNVKEKYFTQSGSRGEPFDMTPEQRVAFKKMITKFYYEGVLDEVHKNHTKFFQETLDQDQEQRYYLGLVKKIVSRTCLTLRDTYFRNDPHMREFLTDASGRFQASMLTNAQVFHDLPLYARDISSFEKWPQFLGNLFPSELAEAFNDEPLMELTRHIIPQYLRRRIVLNGNKIPHDLFSGEYLGEDKDKKEVPGVRFSTKDQEAMKELIRERAKQVGIPIEEEWEIERAMTYGLGIGIANLSDPELIASADPQISSEFRGIYPLASVLSAKQNWGLGRGVPAATEFYDLLKMDVTLFPEKRGLIGRLFKKKSWVPARFHRSVNEQVYKYEGDVLDVFLEREGSYQELLNMVNIGASLISRAGWRTIPIREELLKAAKEMYKDSGPDFKLEKSKWTQDQWNKYFDLCQSKYGMAAVWWLIDSERVKAEMQKLVANKLGSKVDLTDPLFEEYDLGEKEIELEMDVFIDGKPARQKLNYMEAKMMRLYQLRGEAFRRYMNRNPGDFFLIIDQCVPELLTDKDGDVFKTEAQLKDLIGKPHGDNKKIFQKHDMEKLLAAQERIRKRWGEKSFKILKNFNSLIYTELIGDGEGKFKDKEAFVKALTESSGNAFEKMIKRCKENPSSSPYMTRADFNGENNLIIGFIFDNPNGIMNALKLTDPNHPSQFDNTLKFSEDDFGFFYHMGQSWSLKQGSESSINPFPGDINNYELYKRLGKVGEDVVKRYLGDAEMVKKMIDKVSHLDKWLSDIASSGDMKEIFELHESIYNTLKPIIGRAYAHRANYILASLVGRFFYEHSDVRSGVFGVFPFNLVGQAALGKNLSLSRAITGNRNALTMDENALRTYFNKLAYEMHVISHDGHWSNKNLEAAFDAKTDTFFLGNAAPSFLMFVSIMVLWSFLKKAFDEAEGKKK